MARLPKARDSARPATMIRRVRCHEKSKLAILLVIMIVISTQGWYTSRAQSNPENTVKEFPGTAIKWIEVATPEFRRRNLDLNNYTVSIFDDGDSVFVVLISLDQPEGARGSAGTYPGYEVEISKKDMTVLRSYYAK